uniref:Uncharacterized protein n=1 Tax=Anguilla anguilla TaxID=7936 RepID=A0A0E9PNB9_ANGAN
MPRSRTAKRRPSFLLY